VVVLTLVGVGVFVTMSTGHSKRRAGTSTLPALSPAATTSTSGAGESPTNTESSSAEQQETSSTAGPAPQTSATPAPLQALDSYWADIRAHHFSGAYRYLAPGAIELSESQFVASEREARIESVRFSGEVTSNSGTSATVQVTSMVTHDAQFGCRTWTGSYTMEEPGGGWHIAHADLSPQPCSG
jgi:hypothetical protein